MDNVRGMSSVLLLELSKRLDYDIPVGHPFFAWAFVHGCWIMNRFGVRAGVTSCELIRGHSYRGKLVRYGEPLMCYVGDTNQQKGDPKWRPGVFLTKSVSNDMFLVHCESSLKSIYDKWGDHIGICRSINIFPWRQQLVLMRRNRLQWL